MRAFVGPTLEDLLAAARCVDALRCRRPALDAERLARCLLRRSEVARRHRVAHALPHPRYGDGSLSAASALASRRLKATCGGVRPFTALLPSLAAVLATWRGRTPSQS